MPARKGNTTIARDTPLDRQEILIRALQRPAIYAHPVTGLRVLETHISWVILAGEFAYKIKKAVNFGFLDFSTLEKRHYYCQEELRLNRRFAPDLYLDVIAVTGEAERPSLNGPGPVLEYAVVMRRFPQDGLLSRMAADGELRPAHMDAIIQLVAGMHAQAASATRESGYGLPDGIHHWVLENFVHIRPLLTQDLHREQLDRLEQWCRQEYKRIRPLLEHRREDGAVRECHGDLHLGNLALIEGRITPFDCIEFNAQLRWIDAISEAAFLIMDVQDRGYSELAYRFQNGYLQLTGDYDGVRVLRYYLVYRALVRAKVAVLRLPQPHIKPADKASAWQDYNSYMSLAGRYAEIRSPALIITQGVSGSGKSWYAAQLVEALGALCIRSDAERKRLFGYQAGARTQSGIRGGIYTPAASADTYERLAELAAIVIEAGYPVIVDAAFLKRSQRERFRRLALHHEVPLIVLHFQADSDTLQERIKRRQAAGTDPSEAGIEVLHAQLATQDPLQPDESDGLIEITPDSAQPAEEIARRVRAMTGMP
jgi:hypothetical protein